MCKDCNKKRNPGVDEEAVINEAISGMSHGELVQRVIDLEKINGFQCEAIKKLRLQMFQEEKDGQFHMATIQDLEEGIQALVYHIKNMNAAVIDGSPDMNVMNNAEAITLTVSSVKNTLERWNDYFEMEGVEIPF